VNESYKPKKPKTMEKTFKERQIEISDKENVLAVEASNLLADMISSMKLEQKEKIVGHSITDDEYIKEINSVSVKTFDTFGQKHTRFLEEFTYNETKKLINFILIYVFS
jgi:hypothetical protein